MKNVIELFKDQPSQIQKLSTHLIHSIRDIEHLYTTDEIRRSFGLCLSCTTHVQVDEKRSKKDKSKVLSDTISSLTGSLDMIAQMSGLGSLQRVLVDQLNRGEQK